MDDLLAEVFWNWLQARQFSLEHTVTLEESDLRKMVPNCALLVINFKTDCPRGCMRLRRLTRNGGGGPQPMRSQAGSPSGDMVKDGRIFTLPGRPQGGRSIKYVYGDGL